MTLLSPDYTQSVSWGTKVATDALVNLRPIAAQHRFSLRDAIAQCYRIIGVAAVLLSHEDHKVIASVSDPSTELMSVAINAASERDPKRLGEKHALGMMSYVEFAKRKLGLRMHRGLLDIMSQLFERHATAYYAAEPDIHPDVAIGLLYDLSYATAEQGARKTHQVVKGILDELNSIGLSPGRDRIKLEKIKRRKVPINAEGLEGITTIVGSKYSPVIDHATRLERLLVRRTQLQEVGGRSLNLERVERTIEQVHGWVAAANSANHEIPF